MSRAKDFRILHFKNPDWTYKQLAEELNTTSEILRGINQRLKLPVPVRYKAPDGQARKRINKPRGKVKPAAPPPPPPPPKKKMPPRQLPTVLLIGSGRKQYGSYLRLL